MNAARRHEDLSQQINGRWEVRRFGALFLESNERKGTNESGSALSVSEYLGVAPRDIAEGQMASEDLSEYRIVRPGQLAANVMWLNRSGLGVSDLYGYVSPAYKVYDIKDDLLPAFANYLLRSSLYRTEFERLGRGVRPNAQMVDTRDLKSMPVPVPSAIEQRAIADFLDRETAKIDALIEKQHELIALLDERRLSTIDDALRASAGVEGTPLRNVVTIQSGVTLGKTWEDEPGLQEYPYLRVANVQTGRVDTQNLSRIRLPPAAARRSALRAGDVLITEGGDRAALARGSMWHGEVSPCLHQNHIYALRPTGKLLGRFLVYVLEGSKARQYFERTRRQTTNLSATNSRIVRAFRFTLPDIVEQERIVDHLDGESAKIDALIAKTEEHIALAQERRAALITAAVTGQLDIPGETN